MIEVEVRAFINNQRYNCLLKFLKNNAKFLDKDFQVTVYFRGKNDLRVQQTKNFSKLWLKGGRIHETFREEIEIKFAREDFEKLIKFLRNLGFEVEIVWLRRRFEFEWNGVKVCLDDTAGYGKIIELEVLTNKPKKALEKILIKKLKELGVEPGSKEEFEEKFSWYRQNWKKLISKKLDRLNLEFLLS